jgi:hypothetical protein
VRVRASAGASEEAGTARLVVRPSFGEVRCVGRGVRQRRWFGRSPWVLLRACKEVFLKLVSVPRVSMSGAPSQTATLAEFAATLAKGQVRAVAVHSSEVGIEGSFWLCEVLWLWFKQMLSAPC